MQNAEGPNDFLRLAEWLQEGERYLAIAAQLEAEGRKRVILDRESKEPYLVRYYYQNFRPYCRIVLHNILRSDVDGLHDHPWPANTFILKGGYWEYQQDPNDSTNVIKLWRPAGHHGVFNANHFHRLELDPEKAGGPTWTLFMMGPKEKDWGFLDKNNNWVQHSEYIAKRSQLLGINK